MKILAGMNSDDSGKLGSAVFMRMLPSTVELKETTKARLCFAFRALFYKMAIKKQVLTHEE